MAKEKNLIVNLRIIFNAIIFPIKEKRKPTILDILAFRLKKPTKKELKEWGLNEE